MAPTWAGPGLFNISASAGIELKHELSNFFSVNFSQRFEYLPKNSDVLFGSEYNRFKFLKLPTTVPFSCDETSE